MAAPKIGKAKYGITQKKYFKLKDGESKFRILPPLGDLADEGRWSVYYKVHYGYKNSKGKLRVFQSTLVVNKKTKMVEVPDAAATRITDLKLKLEEAKKAGQKAVVDKLGPLVSGQKPMYNLDANHYMNVIDAQGNIGVLKLRYKAKQALDVVIKKLREKGVDPLSVDNGRYFVFTRTGTGLETQFAVEVAQETLTVAGVGEVKRDQVHVLNDELIARLGDEAAQLDKLFRQVSAEDIERIVKASDLLTGQSPVIDELFDNAEGGGSDGDEGEEGGEDEESSTESSSSQSAASSTDVAAAAAPATETAAKPAATETKTETKVETKAETKTETKTAPATPAPGTTAAAVSDMSDADFLKSLGL